MRKYILIIFFVFMVVSASGCVSQGNQTGNQTSLAKTYAQNGITFNYNNTWQEVQNQAPNTIATVGDPKTADSQTGDVKTSVVIQKLDNTSDLTLKQLYDGNYAIYSANNPSYQSISNGTLTLNGTTAYENIYKVDSGVQKQERAVWMEKNNTIYIILCVSLPEDFNKEQGNFDLIINSFQVQ